MSPIKPSKAMIDIVLPEGGRNNKVEQLINKTAFYLERFLNIILITMLAFMSFLIIYQVISRYVFSNPSGIVEELLRYQLIWLGLLGSAVCFLKNRHLNLPLLFDSVSPINKIRLLAFNSVIIILFGAMLAWGGYFSVIKSAHMMTPMLKVSIGALQSVVCFSGLFIIVMQAASLVHLVGVNRKSVSAFLSSLILLITIFFIVREIYQTEWFESLLDNYLELTSTIILFSVLFIFLALGTPIAVGLAFSGLITMGLQIDLDTLMTTVGEKLFGGLDSFGFLALPFFMLAGNIMSQGGIARRLLDLAMLFGRSIPGSLWQANVIANMLFGCLSGSAAASATEIGGIVAPLAKEEKYDQAITTAVNAASAPCGLLIPPTGIFIVYSLITGGSASIAALFLAGYVPGIIMGVSVMIVAYYYAKKLNYSTSGEKHSYNQIKNIVLKAIPSLSLIIVVIGGIICGIFTAIEGSGVAVLYSIILSTSYRSLSLKDYVRIFSETAVGSAVILFIIACSGLMSWSMTFASIPDSIGAFLVSLSNDKNIILLMITISLLVVGTFMDMTPALLIFTPVFYPVAMSIGIDPVHFGIIIVYNLCMGIVTPPVGTVLFISCGVTGTKITKVIKPLLPIFAIQFIGLLLITYFPIFTMFLPRWFGLA